MSHTTPSLSLLPPKENIGIWRFGNFGLRKQKLENPPNSQSPTVLFVGPLIPLFCTSGDFCPGLKSQGGSLVCFLTSVILRFTSGVTPADCIEVSIAAKSFWSTYLQTCPQALVEVWARAQTHHCPCCVHLVLLPAYIVWEKVIIWHVSVCLFMEGYRPSADGECTYLPADRRYLPFNQQGGIYHSADVGTPSSVPVQFRYPPQMCKHSTNLLSNLDGSSSCNWGWFYDQQWLGAKYLLIQRLWIGVTSLFLHVWSQFLTDFDVTSLILKLRTSSTRWSSFCDDQMPVTGLIMAKTLQKLPMSAFLVIIWPFTGIWSSQNLAHLVEEVLSFKMSGLTSKSVKNWLQKWGKYKATSIFTWSLSNFTIWSMQY